MPIDILLVEDNRDIAENIVLYFESAGHRIDIIHSSHGALSLLEKNTYDVFIFDVMLPGMDGFTLAHNIRTQQQITTPIIFLTARDTLDDKREGFIAGADDYMTKPFALEELLLRVLAIDKRATGMVTHKHSVGDWSIDNQLLEIRYKNKRLETTNIGFKLFSALMQHYPSVLSRAQLEKKLWGDNPPTSDALRSHTFALRKAIASVCDKPVIETVHSIGFRLKI